MLKVTGSPTFAVTRSPGASTRSPLIVTATIGPCGSGLGVGPVSGSEEGGVFMLGSSESAVSLEGVGIVSGVPSAPQLLMMIARVAATPIMVARIRFSCRVATKRNSSMGVARARSATRATNQANGHGSRSWTRSGSGQRWGPLPLATCADLRALGGLHPRRLDLRASFRYLGVVIGRA